MKLKLYSFLKGLSIVMGLTLALPADYLFASTPFYWGVSTSSFQAEGSPEDSDWLRFTRRPEAIADGTNADQAAEFWNRYDEDFALAQRIGLNAFRISIAWERIEPKKGQWDLAALEKYRTMITAMRARGLEPVVTLHHFVTPGWLADEGGVVAPDFVEHFVTYAKKVVLALSTGESGVKYWLTLNEPELQVFFGYGTGQWAPGLVGSDHAARALANLAKAHLETVIALRPLVSPDVRFSIAKHWRVFDPKSGNPAHQLAAAIADRLFNHVFLDSLMTGNILFYAPGSGFVAERVSLPGGKPTLDFLGINYYGRSLVAATLQPPFHAESDGPGETNDLGWEVYPEGMERSITDAYQAYHLPVFITENGAADHSDRLRSRFLDDHLASLQKARNKGIPVLGYLHWSLTDNFEWADGLKPRFGLIKIDYRTGERILRPSFWHYGELIKGFGYK